MVDFAIATIGLIGHGLEKTVAAECGFQPQPSRLLAFLTICGPCVCMRKEDDVGVVDLDELKEIGEDCLLRPLELLLSLVEDLG